MPQAGQDWNGSNENGGPKAAVVRENCILPALEPRGFARHARNVVGGQSEIGQFAMAQPFELGNGAAVTLPAAVAGLDKVEHGHSPMD